MPSSQTVLAESLASGLLALAATQLRTDPGHATTAPNRRALGRLLMRGFRGLKSERELLAAVQKALRDAGVPSKEEAQRRWWPEGVLERLGGGQVAVSRDLARAVASAPTGDGQLDRLAARLGWPEARRAELRDLLLALCEQVTQLDAWRAPLDYMREGPTLPDDSHDLE